MIYYKSATFSLCLSHSRNNCCTLIESCHVWEKSFCICLLLLLMILGFDRSVRLLGEVMRMHCPKSRLDQTGTAKPVNCKTVCLIHTIQCSNN